ncbi:MAG: hypothetical protein RLZZ524_606 [Pseudomonadota bacterium]|jgi:formate dehydrogenase maturation protein FdhE
MSQIAVQCPACASRAIKVRSSTRICSYLRCQACAHDWKVVGLVERVLVVVLSRDKTPR